MDQQKFINYYTELLTKNVQELFNKLLLLQTNEKIYTEELGILRKQIEELKQVKPESDLEKELEAMKAENELLKNRVNESLSSNVEIYREQLQKAQERIKELELSAKK